MSSLGEDGVAVHPSPLRPGVPQGGVQLLELAQEEVVEAQGPGNGRPRVGPLAALTAPVDLPSVERGRVWCVCARARIGHNVCKGRGVLGAHQDA